ncbi:hypothetical protein ZEAMMB73_Zm00001d023958 [Zea mays]|uniref:Uncharacterized protein n=1 Tax=Zea mays TaxID=4577 RepID=A0A1D6IX15_MAIZE|nr:hypothetical protein ZEAMMB73_Zm00001d023958 [Zea mays]
MLLFEDGSNAHAYEKVDVKCEHDLRPRRGSPPYTASMWAVISFATALVKACVRYYIDSHVAKGVCSHNSTDVADKPTQGTQGSKRVVAPDVHGQQIRFTRQRSAAINQQSSLSLTTTTHNGSRATTNQESLQNLTNPTQFTSSVATEQDYTQVMTVVAQPSSPIQDEINDHITDEGK